MLNKIEEIVGKINSWEDWYEFEDLWFVWDENSNDLVSFELNRKPISINGITWKPIEEVYNISSENRTFYEMLQFKVFDKLEPEAALDNKAHPERYGRVCYYDLIWTESHAHVCPFCRRKTLIIPK